MGLHTHTITFSTHPAVHVVTASSCMLSEECRDWWFMLPNPALSRWPSAPAVF
jgi:hypothetical protein